MKEVYTFLFHSILVFRCDSSRVVWFAHYVCGVFCFFFNFHFFVAESVAILVTPSVSISTSVPPIHMMVEEKTIKEANEPATEDINHDVMATVDSYHPFFLHANDNPGLSMISIVLTSLENYAMWSRDMHFSLLGRNKLGFVTSTCMREKFDLAFHRQWDRCNVVVFSWIMNSISKELSSDIMYSESVFLARKDLKERFKKVSNYKTYQLHKEIMLTHQGLDSVVTFLAS